MRSMPLDVPMFFALYVYVVRVPLEVMSALNCRLLAPETVPPVPPPRVAKITPTSIATTMMTMTPNAIMVFRLIFGAEVGGEAGGGGGGGSVIVLFCIFIPFLNGADVQIRFLGNPELLRLSARFCDHAVIVSAFNCADLESVRLESSARTLHPFR